MLNKYIPIAAVGKIEGWIKEYGLFVKITAPRKTKFGDYRAPRRNRPPTITINHDLNQYHFLITLVHEIAHASVWQEFKSKAKPHGKEWQEDYRIKLQEIIALSVFPDEMLESLNKHLAMVKASTCSDHTLYRMLKIHDGPNEYIFLNDLPKDAVFELKGGRRFIKGVKRRTRYFCKEFNGSRNYTISGNAEVKILKMQDKKAS